MKIKAAVLHGLGEDLRIENVELADPKENEVLIKVVGTGFCHSDEVGRQGACMMPVVLGHEGAGIIEKVGPNVTSVDVGDHVVLTYSSCGECEFCKADKPFVCVHWPVLNGYGKMMDGTTRISQNGEDINNYFGQSTFATHAVTNVRNVIKIDKDVDLEIMGPLGCGYLTGAGSVFGYMNVQPGTSMVVFGLGSVGMSAIMAAKIIGCETIIAVGGTPAKLDFALEMGATHAINRKEADDLIGEIKKLTKGGRGVDYGFDTTGVKDIMELGIQCLGTMGKMVLVGATQDLVTFNPTNLMYQCQSVAVVVEGAIDPYKFIPQMVEYYKEGQFPIDKLVTFYELDEINQVFEDSANGKVIKPIIRMPK